MATVWASSADDVWISDCRYGLCHWDGVRWSRSRTGAGDCNALWGADAEHIWCLNDTGLLFRER